MGMYNLCMKELLIVVRIVTIMLTKKHLQHVQSLHEGISFNCEHCDHKDKRKSHLLQHVQSLHEGINYNCEYCDYKAKCKQRLFQHVQSVHEGVTYSCEHCDHKAK